MPASRSPLIATNAWRELRARLAQPRRLVVAVLVAIAVICGIDAARPAPPATRSVWVAARDLSGGAPLATSDVRLERLPALDVPGGAVSTASAPVGRLLAAPVRRGEPITDVRLLGPSLLGATDEAGAVAVPVRVADGPAAIALVHPGDLVDVIEASDDESGLRASDDGNTVVHDVRVLAIPARQSGTSSDGDDDAGLLIVAADPHQANALAQAAVGARLSVAVRRPT
jgi:Flp pilus assembly protein CpaB